MSISINNRTVRTMVAASALGLAFAAGTVHGRAVDATPQPPARAAAAERAQAPEHAFTLVDTRQAAVDAERAEMMTAMERVLVGIVTPERALHASDDAKAGWMTALETVLVAQ
jgi:hypothetical protein